MKVAILGAKGSLGQVFVELYKDHEVFALDREDLDITEEEAVMKIIKGINPELIINCAAYNAVDKAEQDRQTAEAINGDAVGYIANAANSVGAKVVSFGTAYIFAGDKNEGYNEDDLPRPDSAYGQSKLMGEMALANNCDNFYLIRTTWLYGKPSVTGKQSFVELMLKLAAEGTEIKAINDEFGQPTYVVDLAHATRALVEEQKPFGTYHLVNEGVASWFDWAKEIFKIKNLKVNLLQSSREMFDRKAPRPQYGVLQNTKFIQLRPWTEALKEYLTTK